jgi:Mg2+ and Co2+ transporter CorA
MFAEGHLLLVLHDLPAPRRIGRIARLFWREPSGQWHSAGGAGSTAPLHAHIEHFAGAIERLEQKTDRAASAETYFGVLKEIVPIHRTAVRLHVALQEARELVPEERELILARDRAGEIERAAELLHSDARNGLDFTMAQRAEEQAEASQRLVDASHRLNLLAAVFLPLTALGAVFGMRLSHGLEDLPSPWMFWLVVATGVVLGLVVRSLFVLPGSSAEGVRREP